MNHKSESGQILVLVLMIVLVALTIGLSIASRTLMNMRNTAQLDQSNRAFSAAEAGIERALNMLKTNADACVDNACKATIDGVESRVEVVKAGGSTDAFGVSSLDKDETIQVNLKHGNGTSYQGSLELYWGLRGDKAAGCSSTAAVVMSIVYLQSGNYGMSKVAIDPCTTELRRTYNGFERLSAANNDPAFMSGGIRLQDGSLEGNYGHRYTLNLAPGGGLVPAGATAELARVRVMYAGPKPVAFNPTGGALLPAQGEQITSTAVVGGKQRTVKVLKTASSLPAIFDYALFNGSTNALTK
jgi:flagellar basal body-associated protein FliL